MKHNDGCDYGSLDLINDSKLCGHLIAVWWVIIKPHRRHARPPRVYSFCRIDMTNTAGREMGSCQLGVGEFCLTFTGRISWFYGL